MTTSRKYCKVKCYKKCEEVRKLDRAICKIDQARKDLRRARELVVSVRNEILYG